MITASEAKSILNKNYFYKSPSKDVAFYQVEQLIRKSAEKLLMKCEYNATNIESSTVEALIKSLKENGFTVYHYGSPNGNSWKIITINIIW